MNWVAFSASLPSKAGSSPRVTLWRRLRRLGAVAPTSGVYILPAQEECVEAFQWFAQEIRQGLGEAFVMHVTHFDGLTDQELIALFQADRREEYNRLDLQLASLEQRVSVSLEPEERDQLQEVLDKLHRHYSEIARVDYFDCPEGAQVAARLGAIARALFPNAASPMVAHTLLSEYRNARWVTRPRPHVDRLACAWLIRRFINPAAVIRYSPNPEAGEIAFDMDGATFGHQGNLCTFETMLRAFGLDDPALCALAESIHEIDLRDGLYLRPETAGVDAILQGWLRTDLSDTDREAHGIALFEGLYTALSSGASIATRGETITQGD